MNKIVMKSVGIGFTINQMKFSNSRVDSKSGANDNFLAIFGNKQCIVLNLDLKKISTTSNVNGPGIKVLQSIKLDLMLDQLGGDLYIKD